MIKIGDVIIRNIQEQVAKNKADIAAFRNVELVLNQFGITVLGRVDEDTDIPETKPGGGDYTYGDAWLVGTETPYDMYIWTRTDDPDVGEFINIGPISMVGPQGPQGEQGPSGTIAIGTVSTGLPGSDASVVNVGTSENAVFNFIIPQGAKGETGSQGERGLTGETGPQGQTGPQGPQGDPGQSFMIVGVITNTSQLPDPTTTQRNYAYVYNDGDASTPDRLYYIIGDPGEETWTYSSLAAAGTTVYVNGNPVSTFNADSKLDAPATAGSQGDVLTLGSNGPEWAAPSGGTEILPTETKTFTSYSELYTYINNNKAKIYSIKATLKSGQSAPQTGYYYTYKFNSSGQMQTPTSQTLAIIRTSSYNLQPTASGFVLTIPSLGETLSFGQGAISHVKTFIEAIASGITIEGYNQSILSPQTDSIASKYNWQIN